MMMMIDDDDITGTSKISKFFIKDELCIIIKLFLMSAILSLNIFVSFILIKKRL